MIEILVLASVILIGGAIKLYTRQKIKDIEGFHGTVKNASKHKVIAKL